MNAWLNTIFWFRIGWEGMVPLVPYGNYWRTCRRIMQHNFKQEAVTKYRPIILEKVTTMLAGLLESPDKLEYHNKMWVILVSTALNTGPHHTIQGSLLQSQWPQCMDIKLHPWTIRWSLLPTGIWRWVAASFSPVRHFSIYSHFLDIFHLPLRVLSSRAKLPEKPSDCPDISKVHWKIL